MAMDLPAAAGTVRVSERKPLAIIREKFFTMYPWFGLSVNPDERAILSPLSPRGRGEQDTPARPEALLLLTVDVALDAIGAGVVLEPLLRCLGELAVVRRLRPAVGLGQAQLAEDHLRIQVVSAADRHVPVGLGQRFEDQLAHGRVDGLLMHRGRPGHAATEDEQGRRLVALAGVPGLQGGH